MCWLQPKIACDAGDEIVGIADAVAADTMHHEESKCAPIGFQELYNAVKGCINIGNDTERNRAYPVVRREPSNDGGHKNKRCDE